MVVRREFLRGLGRLNATSTVLQQQVGLAWRIGASDQALIAQWHGSLTLTLADDGRIARQVLSVNGPSPTPGEPPFSITHDVSYSQFNATSVAAPVQP